MMPWLDARISHSSPSLTGRKPLPVCSYKRSSHSRDLHYRQCLLSISSTGMSVTSSPISKSVAMEERNKQRRRAAAAIARVDAFCLERGRIQKLWGREVAGRSDRPNIFRNAFFVACAVLSSGILAVGERKSEARIWYSYHRHRPFPTSSSQRKYLVFITLSHSHQP
jgi:hypothetical protein